MNDPIAYFITWTKYGTWLPGDQRGWVQRGNREPLDPNSYREKHARAMMTDDAVVLTQSQRAVVERVIVDHCTIRDWFLHARNVRTNHVHVIVTAPVDPEVVREQLKAWASRRLSEAAGLRVTGKNGRRRWWTEKGDIELLRGENNLADAIRYVMEMQ